MQLSVVIPAHNEADNLATLVLEVCEALRGICTFEVVVVDDGSTDGTRAVLTLLTHSVQELRIVRHVQSCGQSVALMSGVDAARGRMIATLDGDGQNDPTDIPRMLTTLVRTDPAEKIVMIAGLRARRRDSWWRLFCSRIANGVRSRVLRDATPDSGCGIKVFYRDTFLLLPRFDHMHRFLPALVCRLGCRVQSLPVGHRPRVHGRSHYGTMGRLVAGIVDLIGVAWLLRRSRVPEYVKLAADNDDRTILDHLRTDRATVVHRPIRGSMAQ